MKKGLAELIFFLDRSGSVSGLESDTIGGFNSLLNKRKQEEGSCVITTVLFDDRYELLHDRINLQGVKPITEKEYYVRGSTALLDAIGRTVNKIRNVQKNTAAEEQAEKVLFIITTDGMENASREYDYKKVRHMIQQQKELGNWEFIFLGANLDAVETAANFGITADFAVDYLADTEGTQLNFDVLTSTISQYRTSKEPLQADWKKRIDEDFIKRKKDRDNQ